ncbi:MAG: hypothetical protein MZU91_12890 [Desulfosudis oleivorans]|nr:hypothetical protein [Desulfosudis oleivorans]
MPGHAQTTQRIPVTEIKPLLGARRRARRGARRAHRSRRRLHASPLRCHRAHRDRRGDLARPAPARLRAARSHHAPARRAGARQARRSGTALAGELLPGRQFSGEAVDACEATHDLQGRAHPPLRCWSCAAALSDRRRHGRKARATDTQRSNADPQERRVLAAQPRRLVLVPRPARRSPAAGTAGTASHRASWSSSRRCRSAWKT